MEQLHFPSKPEIVIGLVGAVGADFEPIKRVLIHELKKLRYHTEFIRLSDLLEEIFGIPRAPQDYTTRTKRLMDQGDELREATDQPDMLAHLAIAAIRRRRQRKHPTPVQGSKSSVLELSPKPSMDLASKPLEGHAFVLHSLKHPAEVDFLRQVYGPSFFLIAAYSKR